MFALPPLVQPAVNTALETRLRERLEVADARIRGFRLAYGRLPASMDELVSEGLATRASIEGIQLNASTSGYRVEMRGPEGPVRIERAFLLKEAPPLPSPSPTPKK